MATSNSMTRKSELSAAGRPADPPPRNGRESVPPPRNGRESVPPPRNGRGSVPPPRMPRSEEHTGELDLAELQRSSSPLPFTSEPASRESVDDDGAEDTIRAERRVVVLPRPSTPPPRSPSVPPAPPPNGPRAAPRPLSPPAAPAPRASSPPPPPAPLASVLRAPRPDGAPEGPLTRTDRSPRLRLSAIRVVPPPSSPGAAAVPPDMLAPPSGPDAEDIPFEEPPMSDDRGETSTPFGSDAGADLGAPSDPSASPADDDPPAPLAVCAMLTARLDLRPEERAEILTPATLAEPRWAVSCAHWDRVVADELEGGEQGTLRLFDDGYVEEVERHRGPIEPEEHAVLVRAEERGQLDTRLSELRLPRAGWMRIKRVWIRTLCADPLARARFFEALRRA